MMPGSAASTPPPAKSRRSFEPLYPCHEEDDEGGRPHTPVRSRSIFEKVGSISDGGVYCGGVYGCWG